MRRQRVALTFGRLGQSVRLCGLAQIEKTIGLMVLAQQPRLALFYEGFYRTSGQRPNGTLLLVFEG